MLRACRRILKPGGRIAFLTIHLAPGLRGARRARGVAAGPPAVRSGRSPAAMLREAGFVEVRGVDVTDDYLRTARAWHDASEREAVEVAAIALPTSYDERQENRRRAIEAIEEGLLRRGLFSATRPR